MKLKSNNYLLTFPSWIVSLYLLGSLTGICTASVIQQEQRNSQLRYCIPSYKSGKDKLNPNELHLPPCATSVEGLLKGLYRDGTVSRDEALLPKWINMSMAVRGQQFAMDHMFSTSVSLTMGLNLLLSIPQIADPLYSTHNSNTQETAAKRYAATIVQVFLWFRRALDNSEDPEGNVEQLNWTLESVRNVRYFHLKAAGKVKGLLNEERNNSSRRSEIIYPLDTSLWEAFERDLEMSHIPLNLRVLPEGPLQEPSVPMNQFSFSTTQFAFLFMTFRPLELGIEKSVYKDDLMAYAHLWAVLGYALGIEDEFNVALQPDLPSLQLYFEQLLTSYYIPNLFNLSYKSKVLIEALAQASTQLFTGVDAEFFLRQSLKRILKIPTPHLDSRTSILGTQYDTLWELGKKPSSRFPKWIPISSPPISLYHFKIGLQYFGDLYSSDESIAKNCFFYENT